jgi:hypothetical protein
MGFVVSQPSPGHPPTCRQNQRKIRLRDCYEYRYRISRVFIPSRRANRALKRDLERELGAAPSGHSGQTPVKLPLVPSKSPGVLDLKDYDFDDLLA